MKEEPKKRNQEIQDSAEGGVQQRNFSNSQKNILLLTVLIRKDIMYADGTKIPYNPLEEQLSPALHLARKEHISNI